MLNKQSDRYELLLKASENLVKTVSDQSKKLDDHENRIVILEKTRIVDSRSQLNIRRRAVQHVSKILGDKNHPEFRKTISRLWHDYWQAFGICSYRDTPASLYDEALKYIDHWRPRPELVNEPDPAA